MDEINQAFKIYDPDIVFSPLCGNVIFGSSYYHFVFSLETFAKIYADTYDMNLDYKSFAKRLWGDVYFNPEKRNFVRKPINSTDSRTFIKFILDPIYKIFSQLVGDVDCNLVSLLNELKIQLTKTEMKSNIKSLIKCVFYKYMNEMTAFVDICSDINPPSKPNINKLKHLYSSTFDDSDVCTSLKNCDSNVFKYKFF